MSGSCACSAVVEALRGEVAAMRAAFVEVQQQMKQLADDMRAEMKDRREQGYALDALLREQGLRETQPET